MNSGAENGTIESRRIPPLTVELVVYGPFGAVLAVIDVGDVAPLFALRFVNSAAAWS